ncbi:pyrroline-5-carboxylate reductase [Chloroflexota bacterium]
MNICFIGGGNMAEAIIAAVITKKLCPPGEITVADKDTARQAYLAQTYGLKIASSNTAAVKGCQNIVLAVKPKNLSDVLIELKGGLQPEQLVISIIAGVSMKRIGNGLIHAAIIRSMPNTPASVGTGLTAWTAAPKVTESQKHTAVGILSVMGKQIFFPEEKYLDVATAISGSGPAYFFLFVEAIAEAGVKLGLAPDTALEMVLQTMLGAGELMKQSGTAPAELRRMVTSKGGTTERALQKFDEAGFRSIVESAMNAAYDRARKMGS